MSGTLNGGEVFSMNMSLVPQGDQWQTVLIGALGGADLDDTVDYAIANYVDEVQMQDLADDCAAWFASENARILSIAHLTRVRLATILSSGKYAGAATEVAVNASGFHTPTGPALNQISRKVTLLTNGDLGRVKGGFYIPAPNTADMWVTDQLDNAEKVSQVQASVITLINNIENGPGWDAEGYRVVVASQGRHNHDGTVRRPPTNHDVVGVSVGQRFDVQRRRANKIGEHRGAVTLLS